MVVPLNQRCSRLVCGLLSRELADASGYECGVVLDEPEQRRATRVLPRQAHEVEAGDIRDAAPVTWLARFVGDREIGPGVVGAESCRPDDRADLEFGPVVEGHGASVRSDSSPMKLDTSALGFLRTRADERFLGLRAPPDPRLGCLVDHACFREPPEGVAAEQAL